MFSSPESLIEQWERSRLQVPRKRGLMNEKTDEEAFCTYQNNHILFGPGSEYLTGRRVETLSAYPSDTSFCTDFDGIRKRGRADRTFAVPLYCASELWFLLPER